MRPTPCDALAPGHSQVDDDYLQILDENLTDKDLPQVEQAVASCPKSAISIAGE